MGGVGERRRGREREKRVDMEKTRSRPRTWMLILMALGVPGAESGLSSSSGLARRIPIGFELGQDQSLGSTFQPTTRGTQMCHPDRRA